MLLTKLLELNIQTYGEYPFLYYKEELYTNKECGRRANQVSILLEKLGVQKGDRVVCCLPNCPEVFFSYLGILQTGAVVVPVMHLLHEKEIHYILKNSEAKAIITSSDLLSKAYASIEGLSARPEIVCVDEFESDEKFTQVCKVDWSSGPSVKVIARELLDTDIAVILYTSGTTGRPKGVMLTHKNLYTSVSAVPAAVGGRTREKTLVFLPLAHVYGFEVMNSCFLSGSSAVVYPKFQVEDAFAGIEKYRVKSFSTVPAMVHAMVTSPLYKKYDLSSLEWISSGSAMLPVSLIREFRRKFKAEVLEGYGLSEASPTVTTHRGVPVKEGSVGVPIPSIQIKIVCDKGEELSTGEVGELIVKGDNVTQGYFRNEEMTKDAIRDGWLHTGDLARVDEDGYVYIVDRKKDLIIRGGFNIYPRDLEELISKYEGVSEVAVFGVPCERMGEEIVACVVPQDGCLLTKEELLNYCKGNMAKHKIPQQVVFVTNIPRNRVGKVLKNELRDMYSNEKIAN